MWYKIKEGKHRASPLSFGIHFGKTSESYEVIFDESCRYTLEGTDKEDWNKLVGWSYGILPWRKQVTFCGARCIGDTEIFEWESAHHKDSIRVGWRYNSELDKIELASYIYSSGRLSKTNIATVELNKKAEINIFRKGEEVIFVIDSFWYHEEKVSFTSRFKSTWGYKLGIYFGGRNDITGKDNVAPHDMKIWLRKI